MTEKYQHELYCGKTCRCRNCLLWWSGRCPHGECYDSYRAVHDPYDKAHPSEPPRKGWSNWNKPGEQGFWCRCGIHYSECGLCEHFIEYDEQKTTVKTCLLSNVCVYQDGYIDCSLLENMGCEECFTRWQERQKEKN